MRIKVKCEECGNIKDVYIKEELRWIVYVSILISVIGVGAIIMLMLSALGVI